MLQIIWETEENVAKSKSSIDFFLSVDANASDDNLDTIRKDNNMSIIIIDYGHSFQSMKHHSRSALQTSNMCSSGFTWYLA